MNLIGKRVRIRLHHINTGMASDKITIEIDRRQSHGGGV
jgi:hypothetical protein